VIAGAVGATVLSLILFLLGTGIGLTMVSPWGDKGMSATTASIATIAWVTFVQIAASLLGGYLAGRLRARWRSVHTHEVYFRDTAHGFLAWSLGTLLMATLLSSEVGMIVSTGAQAGAAVAGTAATVAGSGLAGLAGASGTNGASGAGAQNGAGQQASPQNETEGYFVDALFRPMPGSTSSASPGAPGAKPGTDAEVMRIFANALQSGSLPPADAQYLAQLVSASTGLTEAEAQMRVTDTFNRLQQSIDQAKTKAKEAADVARKASAYTSLWLVVSLLIGAFVASWAATLGGRLRDASALTVDR
jgi:hypothetical protein